MKTVYELSKELQAGLADLHKNSGFDALCREITNRVANMKSEVLTAWVAEHGFEPGKAVLVEERTESGWKVYIRERTAEEAERALAPANRQITPCERHSCCNCVNVSCPLNGVNCSKFVQRTA